MDLSSFQEAIRHMEMNFIECRDLGHQWIRRPARRTADGFLRKLDCRNCEAHKEQYLDRDGYVMHNRIIYPDGYLLPSGIGHVDRAGRALLRLAG